MPKLKKENKKSVPVILSKELPAVYSNVVNITASKNEVFFDFITASPSEAKVVSKVIMSIGHTKGFAKVLSNFVKKIK